MTNRNEIIAALCLFHEGDKGKELYRHASSKDQAALLQLSGQMLEKGDMDQQDLLARIQRTHLKKYSALQEIHPAWILEHLAGESPRVLGILCRYLSSDKVRYLIEQADQMRRPLPKISETYRVSSEVSDVVLERVEKIFSYSIPPQNSGTFSFSHLSLVKHEDFKKLFRDLGLEEIRKAFTGVEPAILKAFLVRFSLKMAQEIRDRIERGAAVPQKVRQEAQKHLLNLSLEELPLDDLFQEIGYSVMARALSKDDRLLAEFIVHKMPPKEGHRLRRIFHETPATHSAEIIQERKQAILGRMSLLTEKKEIRRYWKG